MPLLKTLITLLLALTATFSFAELASAQLASDSHQQKLKTLLENLADAKARINKNTAKQNKLQQTIARTEKEIGNVSNEQRELRQQQQ